jgi:hypothetical protein
MKVTAMLCNHAEAQNNVLYLSGAGIDRSIAPPGTPGPWGANLGIGVLVNVPWTATNEQHTLLVTLIDADGHAVKVPTGPDTQDDFRAEMVFNVGRPPELPVGDEQTVSLAINMPGLPLTKLGRYRFVIEVDGTQEAELSYRLIMPTAMTLGMGPASLPRL